MDKDVDGDLAELLDGPVDFTHCADAALVAATSASASSSVSKSATGDVCFSADAEPPPCKIARVQLYKEDKNPDSYQLSKDPYTGRCWLVNMLTAERCLLPQDTEFEYDIHFANNQAFVIIDKVSHWCSKLMNWRLRTKETEDAETDPEVARELTQEDYLCHQAGTLLI